MAENNLKELVITRTIVGISRKRVVSFFADKSGIRYWLIPREFYGSSCDIDLNQMGRWSVELRKTGTPTQHITGYISDIKPYEQINFKSEACEDAQRHPRFTANNSIIFEDARGDTKITVKVTPVKLDPALQPMYDRLPTYINEILDNLDRTVRRQH